jgi:hypothetical protein
MRFRSKLAAVLFCSIVATGLQAETLTFSDGEFEEANWDIELFNFHSGGTASASQVASGGNPGAYFRVDHMTNAATDPDDNAAIYAFHGLTSAAVDPGVEGAVTSVDYSWDVRAIESASGSGGFFGPALRQGDRYYVSAGNLELVGTDQDWRPVERLGMTEASFGRIQDVLEVDPADDPDFSASGEPIVFGFFSAIAGAMGGSEISLSHGYDNWEVVVQACPAFAINAGLNDAWYNAATSGQGFFFTVYPELGLMFLAWFTYDSERPDESVMVNLGEPGHRWVTAFGEYSGNTAVLDVELTSGGVFDSAEPMPMQESGYGTITITFCDCNHATLMYDFPSLGLTGTIELTRIADDNVAECESINAGMLQAMGPK